MWRPQTNFLHEEHVFCVLLRLVLSHRLQFPRFLVFSGTIVLGEQGSGKRSFWLSSNMLGTSWMKINRGVVEISFHKTKAFIIAMSKTLQKTANGQRRKDILVEKCRSIWSIVSMPPFFLLYSRMRCDFFFYEESSLVGEHFAQVKSKTFLFFFGT